MTPRPGRGLLPEGWQRYRHGNAPKLDALCIQHALLLPRCDACASLQVMAAWSNGLSAAELHAALIVMIFETGYYTDAERRAILFEAARRLT